MNDTIDDLLRSAPAGNRKLFPVVWGESYREELRKFADGERKGHSPIDQRMSQALLLCTDGDFAAAEDFMLSLLRDNVSEIERNGETLISLLNGFFTVQRTDVVSALLARRFGFADRLDIRFEETGDGVGVLRWDISRQREHQLVFDAAVLRGDVSRVEVLNLYWEFPVFAHYAAQPAIEHGSVVLARGDIATRPGLGYCGASPDIFLIPDPIFVPNRGYERMRRDLVRTRPKWEDRRPVAFWRGATTGMKRSERDWRDLERIRLCEIARQNQHTGLFDVGLSNVAQFADPSIIKEISESGLIHGPVPSEQWSHYRYQIDVDGNASAFAGMVHRLLTGSPVLKVTSSRGLLQWFYADLIPWHNYVPVSSDMSDLVDKVQWLHRNDDFAQEVGRNGLALAESMTLERELERTVPVISAAFRYFRKAPGFGLPYGIEAFTPHAGRRAMMAAPPGDLPPSPPQAGSAPLADAGAAPEQARARSAAESAEDILARGMAARKAWANENSDKLWSSRYELESFESVFLRPHSSVQLIEAGRSPLDLTTPTFRLQAADFAAYTSNPDSGPVMGTLLLKNVKIAQMRVIVCENKILYGNRRHFYGVFDLPGVFGQLNNAGLVPVEYLRERPSEKPVILLNSGAHVGYGHWLVEILPELFFLAKNGHDLSTYNFPLSTVLPDFALEMLSYVGVSQDQVISYEQQEEAIVASEALLPLLPHNSVMFAPEFSEAVSWFRQLVEQREGPLRASGRLRRIFIARSNAYPAQPLLNAERIIELAQSYGLEVVYPEHLPLVEQWRIFADAALVVGEYGSALHASMFSPRGTIVCCLRNPNSGTMLLQSGIGQALGQRVEYIYGQSVAGHGNLAFTVDEGLFRDTIARLVRDLERTPPASG